MSICDLNGSQATWQSFRISDLSKSETRSTLCYQIVLDFFSSDNVILHKHKGCIQNQKLKFWVKLAASDEDHGLRTPEQKLEELLKNVEDITGKEDLVSYLRMQVLQKVILP
jgi:hypothetical protein